MERQEFNHLHLECANTLGVWVREATRTCEILGLCSEAPLSSGKRLALQQQRARENDARDQHAIARDKLFVIAQFGYGNP
jgi:hypothetical protein